MKEGLEEKKKRAALILRRLKKAYPNADTALHYTTPMQLVVAVILSAQTTDAHVNRVTEALFKKYRSAKDFASAPAATFTKEVSSVNFFNNKAKNIIAAARSIEKEHGGVVPDTMERLVALPGVGRKTANVILWHIYGRAEGIVVDTHVRRVANALGLTNNQDAVKIERDLMALFPKKEWGRIGNLFQAYGRGALPARGKGKDEDCLIGLY